jgi:hypothetical protein
MCKIIYIFVNKYFIGCINIIFYDATIHKIIFGSVYCRGILLRILMKFILYFSEVSRIFYLISKFGAISVN